MVETAGRVTLKDVAQQTGYAVITVSKALRGSKDLAESTRERIVETARTMGYVRNANALSLRSGVSHTIALIVSDISNPLFGVIARYIEAIARQAGYVMLVMNTDEQPQQELEAINAAISLNIGGVLIFPCPQSDASLGRLRESGVPFVVLGRSVDGEAVDSVLLDDEHGGYLATHDLLERGYRRILMLNADTRISSARDRYRGYRSAYAAFGLEPPENLHVVCGSMAGSCARIVVEKRADSYDAIFAFSDLLAFEAIAALQTIGLNAPEEIGLVGFDNIGSEASYAPALDTIAIPKQELAQRAMELLMRRMEAGNGLPPQRLVLDVKLVKRR